MSAARVNHDVFLSHRYADRDAVQALHDHIENELGYSVYVDWIEQPDLDRSAVTPEVAEHFRTVMRSCSVLVFHAGPNAPDSKWMPWELGFFDGRHGARRIAVYAEDLSRYTAAQQEYLRLYEIVDRASLPEFLDQALNDTAAMTSATVDQWQRHADKIAKDPFDYGLSVMQWCYGVAANTLLDPERRTGRADEQPEGPLREPAQFYAPWYQVLRQQQAAYATLRRDWRLMRKSMPAQQWPAQWPGGFGEARDLPAAPTATADGPVPAGRSPDPFSQFALAMNQALVESMKRFAGGRGRDRDDFDNWYT